MENKQCNKCIWNGRNYCSEMSKELPFPKCVENSALNKAQSSILEQLLNKEYNTDTSIRRSNKSDDIVRTTSNKEGVELQNKESVR